MKPRAPKLLGIMLTCLSVGVLLKDGPARAADTPAPVSGPSASPAPTDPAKRGDKSSTSPDRTPKPTRVKKPKELAFPLPINEKANGFKIPQYDRTGILLSLLDSLTITRKDNEHVEMQGTHIALNHPDGKEDFHVELPDAILDLKTNIITSDHPVTVRTADFELTGERMQFNTVERTGELQGHVHMVIHNFKQVAGVVPSTPAP